MLPYTMPNGAKNITVNEQKIAADSDKNNFFNIVLDLIPDLSVFKILYVPSRFQIVSYIF